MSLRKTYLDFEIGVRDDSLVEILSLCLIPQRDVFVKLTHLLKNFGRCLCICYTRYVLVQNVRGIISCPSTTTSSPFKIESLKADNVLTVAFCQHPAGLSSGFLSLSIIANDSNDPTDLGATINLKASAAALGDAWAQFPESFRKAIEED